MIAVAIHDLILRAPTDAAGQRPAAREDNRRDAPMRRQIERGHLVQRTVGLAAASRGSHVIVDESVGHGVSRCALMARTIVMAESFLP